MELTDKLKSNILNEPNKIFDRFNVSRDFNITYEEAEELLKELLKNGIVKEKFIIVCPECNRVFKTLDRLDEHLYPNECYKCDCEIEISKDDIYPGYIKNNS
ncbi:hypothetical protein ACSW9V_15100 (plasmid) [Clostridium perfringens]|uniref:hypothetical protein n=1 Tax=Clostridium perfringens TaxID=1502 RepID=UPI000B3A404B|nr:hypothetical protein [Clostridium perfringens]EGT0690806.1 hypothetical protein [Clostridium perfringens]EGT0693585.1 hypothetical protein [Clostridium perfringens]EGT0696542.1 hypothetical protein [Clostridium perfringens]MDU3376209.1 hypothetical protein [Clostridium perfringens]MDU3534165.1 hypothetical protein [Clostridium perfringens]